MVQEPIVTLDVDPPTRMSFDRMGVAASATAPLNMAMVGAMAGLAVLSSSMGVRAENEGFSATTTSLVMAAYYVGFITGAKVAAALIERRNRRVAYLVLVTIAAISAVPVGLAVHPAAWALFRIGNGVAQAGIYVVMESWMNGLSANNIRARLMSLYMTIGMVAMAAGQLLFAALDPDNPVPYLVAAGLYLVSAFPVMASKLAEPDAERSEAGTPLGLIELVRRIPVGAGLAVLGGMAMGALGSMGAVYAKRKGLTDREIAAFMICMTTSSVLFQWPVGALADRVSRRAAALTVGAAGLVFAVIGWFAAPNSLLGFGVVAVVGGCGFVLYSLAAASTHDEVSEHERVAANGSMMFWTGAGSLLGPLSVGAAFSVLGDNGFYAVLAVILGLVGVVGTAGRRATPARRTIPDPR